MGATLRISIVGALVMMTVILVCSPAIAAPVLSARVRPNPCPSSPSVQPWLRGTVVTSTPLDRSWFRVLVKTRKGKLVGFGTATGTLRTDWWLKRTATGYRFRFILWRSRSWDPASPYYMSPSLFRPGRYRAKVWLRDKSGELGSARAIMRITKP